MKIRSGFVSNSSSSSFVIIGFKVSEECFNIYDTKMFINTIYIDGECIVGHILGNNEILEIGEVSIPTLNNIVKNVCKEYNKKETEINLYFGTT